MNVTFFGAPFWLRRVAEHDQTSKKKTVSPQLLLIALYYVRTRYMYVYYILQAI